MDMKGQVLGTFTTGDQVGGTAFHHRSANQQSKRLPFRAHVPSPRVRFHQNKLYRYYLAPHRRYHL